MAYDLNKSNPNKEEEAVVVVAAGKKGVGGEVVVFDHGCAEDPDQNGGEGGGEEMLGDINGVMFSDEAFPSLPDFPCLSSPSCAPRRSCSSPSPSSSNSSYNTSWSVARVRDEENGTAVEPIPAAGVPEEPGGGEEFLGMELLDEGLWDPSCFFRDDEQTLTEPAPEEGRSPSGGGGREGTEDLAAVFFEWLKSNRETLSPEDLRSIKLKRSTVEHAVRRLGGGREGMKHLLKLILGWVQSHHLEKRRRRRLRSPAPAAACIYNQQQQQQQQRAPPMAPVTAPGSCSISAADGYCSWFPAVDEPAAAPAFSYTEASSPVLGIISNESLHAPEPISIWPPQVPPQPLYPFFPQQPSAPPYLGGYGGLQQPIPTAAAFIGDGHGESSSSGLGPFATKDARKKRMARQRRLLSLHHHRHHRQLVPPPPPPPLPAQLQPQPPRPPQPPQPPSDSWVDTTRQWTPPAPAVLQHQQHPTSNHTTCNLPPPSSDHRRQPEQNLRFLLQKLLKQSDVGSLGRIVLPKKEAESQLPELEARDGIPIAMEDLGTARTWNMRYRFWPNNKSRMYLLENTGEFIKANGLQEGDFVVIYSDVKSGKFMIQGVRAKRDVRLLPLAKEFSQ